MSKKLVWFFVCTTALLFLLELFFWKGYASILTLLSYLFALTMLIFMATIKELPFHHPVFFLFLNAFIGVSVRGLVMSSDTSDEVNRLFIRGEELSVFAETLLMLIVALFLFGLGYWLSGLLKSDKDEGVLSSRKWTDSGVRLFELVFLGIALSGTLLYISKMGIADSLLLLQNVSSKRHLMIEGKSAALGYERWAASLSSFVFYVNFIIYLSHEELQLRRPSKAKLLFYLLFSLFLPFVTSSRSSAVFVLVNSAIIYSIYKTISVRGLLIYGITGLVFFQGMTQLRKVSVQGGVQVSDQFFLLQLAEPVIMNRNLLDLSKTTHVINAVPEKKDFLYGSSFFNIFVAPIPRSIWPNKPDIQIGLSVAEEIYGLNRSLQTAIPPGVIGELYMNFGWIGVLFGSFFLGYLFRRFWMMAHEGQLIDKPNRALLFVLLILPLTIYLPGSSALQAAIRILQFLFTLIVARRLLSWS